MMNRPISLLLAAASLRAVSAVSLDTTNQASIRSASKDIATNIFTYYSNAAASSTVPAYLVGTFPYPPYYWWESGGVWGGMVDYWAYTKDTTWLQDTMNAMAAQVGPAYDFVMPQQMFDTGNDDQAFWVFPALSALEYGMPTLPCPSGTSNSATQMCQTNYLNLAVNAFNDYVSRWNVDSSSCGGGLKWQFYPSNAGFDYKNSVSNGAFFQIAARLARYTGNATYATWAEKVFEWTQTIGLIDSDYYVYDGTDDLINCTQIDHTFWTYNSGMYMYGAAVMYNYTNGGAVWKTRLSGLLNTASDSFFSLYPNATGIMYEAPCESIRTCTTDQFSFKAYLARWMAKSGIMAPYIKSQVMGLLTSTSVAAAQSCTGGSSGTACGSTWWTGGYDGSAGVGQQLSALEVVQALLIDQGPVPATTNSVPALVLASSGTAVATTSPTATPVASAAPTSAVGGVILPAASSAAIASSIASSYASVSSAAAASSAAISSAAVSSAAASSAAAATSALATSRAAVTTASTVQVVPVAASSTHSAAASSSASSMSTTSIPIVAAIITTIFFPAFTCTC